ncbi:MAG: hypothetical protein JXR96_30330 [Deltaproteobacteria bacterium]|nr:hypothetical protein [Deltaproteobacteria bacterium]
MHDEKCEPDDGSHGDQGDREARQSGGSIAVEPTHESAFVMKKVVDEDRRVVEKTLLAVQPDSGKVTTVADMRSYGDVRILFPQGMILIMGEIDGQDELRKLDAGTLAELDRKDSGARYNGTRLSPSGAYLAVADNDESSAPIHLIEIDTLSAHVIPHDGDWLEAMWLNASDELAAIVFYDTDDPDAHARLLLWDVPALDASGFEQGAGGLWAEPSLDIDVPGAKPDMLFSFTWVGVSPDDAYAVFPVRQYATHKLLVLEIASGELRLVDDARGPVGFTPDGGTIVSYRYLDDGHGGTDPFLLMIDTLTLEQDLVELPGISLPQYFVTRDGNFVVVASSLGGEKLLLFDVDTGQTAQLEGPGLALHEFISRTPQGELWLVDGGLFRLDLFSAELETVPLDFLPQHINILRQRDLLVLDDPDKGRLVYFDPDSLDTVRSVTLP